MHEAKTPPGNSGRKRIRWQKPDELPPPPPPPVKTSNKIVQSIELNSLDGFIQTVDSNKLTEHYHRLKLIMPVLRGLNKLVGMSKLKHKVLDMVLFHIQGLANPNDDGLHHVVISGSPGVGKTAVVKILAQLYHALGMLSTPDVRSVRRDDMIARYTGQTAPKTQAVLEKALGGVLILDEAYAMNNGRDDDPCSFSKECLDQICRFLTENNDFLMIIAGYEDALQRYFFSVNEGLSRRFPYRFHIDDYTPTELRHIFVRQVKKARWVPPDKLPLSIFDDNALFKHNGGSCLNLFQKCQLAHARRVFADITLPRKKLTLADIKAGLAEHAKHCKADANSMDQSISHMYT